MMKPTNRLSMTRRQMLKTAAGATFALPFLESFHALAAQTARRRCLMAINMPLGLYAGGLFPEDLTSPTLDTEYLASFREFHDRMTLISGLYHPGVANGHVSTPRIFTGTPNMSAPDPKLAPNGESFDQVAARHLGQHTRFGSLTLAMGGNAHSWHANGMAVVSHSEMPQVFRMLFEADSKSALDAAHQGLDRKRSVLDAVLRDASGLKANLSKPDRDKLEEYFHAVRETEKNVAKENQWLDTPKPQVDGSKLHQNFEQPGFIPRVRNLLDISHLALSTDSTRIIACDLFEQGNVSIDGVNNGYHGLSHHGKDEENIRQLKIIETSVLAELKRFIGRMAETTEPDGSSLLDNTTIVLVSNLGNASNHSSQNLPVLVVGGGYQHGRHINYTPANETPLCNLYLTILQSMGVPMESFSTSTGTIKALV